MKINQSELSNPMYLLYLEAVTLSDRLTKLFLREVKSAISASPENQRERVFRARRIGRLAVKAGDRSMRRCLAYSDVFYNEIKHKSDETTLKRNPQTIRDTDSRDTALIQSLNQIISPDEKSTAIPRHEKQQRFALARNLR
jgi:hypothetical protein